MRRLSWNRSSPPSVTLRLDDTFADQLEARLRANVSAETPIAKLQAPPSRRRRWPTLAAAAAVVSIALLTVIVAASRAHDDTKPVSLTAAHGYSVRVAMVLQGK